MATDPVHSGPTSTDVDRIVENRYTRDAVNVFDYDGRRGLPVANGTATRVVLCFFFFYPNDKSNFPVETTRLLRRSVRPKCSQTLVLWWNDEIIFH